MRMFQTSCDCGWQSKPGSEGRAAYALRMHSCDAHRERQARQARRRVRRAAVDRTPKPCRHKVAHHEHGTYAAYKLDSCRCWPCTRATRVYNSNRTRQAVYGRWQPFVDAEPARRHVLMLKESGLGYRHIAKLAGLAPSNVGKLVYGERGRPPSRRIRPRTEARLLAVQPVLDNLGATVNVDGTGTRRRLQALVALGWSQRKLAHLLKVEPANLQLTIRSRRVNASTARAVRDLFDQLSMTPPPERTRRERQAASRARNYAKARNWAAPLAWDDDDIDDPVAEPSRKLTPPDVDVRVDEVAVARRIEGDVTVRLTIPERKEATRILHARGLLDDEIADVIGVDNRRTVLRYRQEMGLAHNYDGHSGRPAA